MLILIVPFGLFLHLILKGINHEASTHEPVPQPAELHETRVPDSPQEHDCGPDARRNPAVDPWAAGKSPLRTGTTSNAASSGDALSTSGSMGNGNAVLQTDRGPPEGVR